MSRYIQRNDWMPIFKERSLGEHSILTSQTGSWMILTREERAKLDSIRLEENLFNRLEKKGLILTQKNHGEVINAYQEWNEPKYHSNTPLHIVNITDNCNLQCKYCSASVAKNKADMRAKTMSQQTGRAVVDFIFAAPNNGSVNIEFQGGEVLMAFDTMKSMVDYAREKAVAQGIEVTFGTTTNLVALTQKHCEFFRENDFSIATSLDGPKSIHDGHRVFPNNKGTFEAMVRSIELLEKNQIGFGILAVITAKSKDRYEEIVEMYQAVGKRRVIANFIRPMGDAVNDWDELGLDNDEYLDSYRKLLDHITAKWKDGNFLEERMLQLTLNKILNRTDVEFTDYRTPCGMARGQIGYDIHGSVFTCYQARHLPKFKLGDVFNDTYEEIVASNRLADLLSESIPHYEECGTCPYSAFCGVCPAVNNERSVNRAKDDTLCQLSQFLVDYVFEMMIHRRPLLEAYLLHRNYEMFQKECCISAEAV